MFSIRVPRLVAVLFVALCLALCATLLLAGRSDASSIRVSFADLSARSQLVVRGRVERIAPAWTPERKIESTIYLRVNEAPRGPVSAGALIPVHVRGGTVDDMTMVSSEEPAFGVGEEVYLFLTGITGNAYRVVEGQQGKFEVIGDRAINRAWQAQFRLADLQAGVREGRWPSAPLALTPVPGGTPEPAALLSDPQLVAGALPDNYKVNGQRWPGSRPVEEGYEINVNTGDAGGGNGSATAFRDAIVAAGLTWNHAGANFAFTYNGASGVTTSGNDGRNVVHWENMGTGSTLAEATWWFQGDRIVEADIRFNDHYTWDATGWPGRDEVDLQSVATHELGHWLSLGHDNDGGCPNADAIMCASYIMGTLKRSLGANDVAGIKAIYGASQVAPTATRTPRPTLAPWQIKSRVRLPLILRR